MSPVPFFPVPRMHHRYRSCPSFLLWKPCPRPPRSQLFRCFLLLRLSPPRSQHAQVQRPDLSFRPLRLRALRYLPLPVYPLLLRLVYSLPPLVFQPALHLLPLPVARHPAVPAERHPAVPAAVHHPEARGADRQSDPSRCRASHFHFCSTSSDFAESHTLLLLVRTPGSSLYQPH